MFAQIASVILSILIVIIIMSSTKGLTEESFDNLLSKINSIGFSCLLFYIVILLLLAITAGYAVNYFMLKEREKEIIVPGIINAVTVLDGLILLPTISAVSKLASGFSQGDLNAIFGTSISYYDVFYNIQDSQGLVIMFVLLQIGALAVTILFLNNVLFPTSNVNCVGQNNSGIQLNFVKESETNKTQVPPKFNKEKLNNSGAVNVPPRVPVEEKENVCPNCKHSNFTGAKFCVNCGSCLR